MGSDRQRLWERVNFALSYPFAAPEGDYAHVDGAAYELVELGPPEALAEWTVRRGAGAAPLGAVLKAAGAPVPRFEALTAVIASGSNASPLQLTRKFDPLPPRLSLCLRAEVAGARSVYAAHIAPYGSMPAAFSRQEGARERMVVNFLAAEPLALMHETESLGVAYELAEAEAEVARGGFSWRGRALAYACVTGLLRRKGDPAPLALAELSQWGAQQAAIDLLEEATPVQTFVLQNILEPELRRARERR
ncbi:MAG: hypothetical protein AAFR16_04405, partial [Pseudomonadota bacterium]